MTAPPPRHFPPSLRRFRETPPDPYATTRRILRATEVLAFFLSTVLFFRAPYEWKSLWPLAVLAAVCEVAIFALVRHEVEDQPADAFDARVQIGCGAAFGLVAGFIGTFTWAWSWGWTVTGVGLVAGMVASALLSAWLALRFGTRFWDWVFTLRSPW